MSAMSAPALRHLTLDERALVTQLISEGLFEDEDDFEEFAVRSAIAQFQRDELWDLRNVRPPPRLTRDEILKEVWKVRRAVARKYES